MEEDADVRCLHCGYIGELSEFTDEDLDTDSLECPDCGGEVTLEI